jgi:shikimate dehydrogenase
MNDIRRYGLLGDPVTHTLSPRLYRVAFAYLNIPAVYEAYRVPKGDATALGRRMLELGSSGGGNVTLPHKGLAASHLEVSSTAVGRTGACNCFWLDTAGRLAGDNTDVEGFLAAATDLNALRLEGASVLLLGAGGGARAVALACSDAGVGRLVVYNRTVGRAEALVSDLGIEEVATVGSHVEISSGRWDLVVNATSLGLMPGDPLPLTLEPDRFGCAFDLVYGLGGTEWTRHAVAMGIQAIDGLSMLVSQAVLSLERWLGPLPDRASVAREMWRAASAFSGDASR